MVDFTPGIARAKAAGYKIDAAPYPDGPAGIRQSLEVIARKSRDGRLDPDIRGWAGDVLIAAGKPQGVRAQAQVLTDAFRRETLYISDPLGAEYIAGGAATMCLRPGLCVRARDCIPEGTLLLRDDYELVPIEKIRPGERIWGHDKWTVVKSVWPKGPLKVDAITTNTGSTIYLTRDHKVYVGKCEHDERDCYNVNCAPPGARTVEFERITVGELEEGHTLLRPERIEFGSGAPDPDRMYIEGLALSDGWTTGTCRQFYISGKDGFRKEKQKREVKAICDRLGIETRWHRRYITVKDVDWARKIHHLGAYARFKHAETLNLGEAAAAALLRGIMADSTQNSNGPGRTYSTTSYTMMVQARVLHRMFGVTTGIHLLTPEMHRGAGKHPMWRMQVWSKTDRAEKALAVKRIDRNVMRLPCWDITTEDHYVYLPEHDVTVSNCDDSVVFMASALMSLGYHVRVIKQNFGPEHQEHVLLEVQDESGNWLPIDPSTDLPVGSSHQAVEEVRLDPMQQVGSTGTAGAEIVTLGAPPRTPFKGRALFYKGNHWYEFRYGRWWVYADGRWHMGPGEPPVGIGESYCGSCSGAGASLVEGGQHPNDPPKLASAVWEVIRPYQEQQAHVGFGDLPAGNWVMVPDLTVQAGSRYVVIVGAPPKGLIFKDPWTQDDARNYFEPNWSIESLSRQDVDSASDTAWQMQGIARRSTQLTASPDAAKVSTAILWKESTPSPPAKPPGTTPADTSMSTSTKVAIGVAAGAVVIGGVALYKWKRRKRGGSGGTVRL